MEALQAIGQPKVDNRCGAENPDPFGFGARHAVAGADIFGGLQDCCERVAKTTGIIAASNCERDLPESAFK